MPCIQYVKKRFNAVSAGRKQGFDLTLRRIYYQFVSNDLISDSCLVGLVDRFAIQVQTPNGEQPCLINF